MTHRQRNLARAFDQVAGIVQRKEAARRLHHGFTAADFYLLVLHTFDPLNGAQRQRDAFTPCILEQQHGQRRRLWLWHDGPGFFSMRVALSIGI